LAWGTSFRQGPHFVENSRLSETLGRAAGRFAQAPAYRRRGGAELKECPRSKQKERDRPLPHLGRGSTVVGARCVFGDGTIYNFPVNGKGAREDLSIRRHAQDGPFRGKAPDPQKGCTRWKNGTASQALVFAPSFSWPSTRGDGSAGSVRIPPHARRSEGGSTFGARSGPRFEVGAQGTGAELFSQAGAVAITGHVYEGGRQASPTCCERRSNFPPIVPAKVCKPERWTKAFPERVEDQR